MIFVKTTCGTYLNVAFIELIDIIEDLDKDGLYNIVASTKTGIFCIHHELFKEEADSYMYNLINEWRSI